MSMYGSITDMQSDTAQQAALDYAKKMAESSKDGRKVGGDMGKNDFLLLLSAQLRHQDPLNPQSDADFSAQLAQFSSLEQMQNMNETLSSMSFYQSYSLIGKYVLAEAQIDGKFEEIAGVVDSIFNKDGVSFAQIGEYVVPVASILEVFDTNNILTSEMFLQVSSYLIGRTVIAEVDGEEIEGIVTRVLVDKGILYAQIDDGTDEPKFVPVNTIVDIRETGSERYNPYPGGSGGSKPATPPDAMNFRADPNGSGFIEYNDDFTKAIGRWDWDEVLCQWVYTEYAASGDNTAGDGSNIPGDGSNIPGDDDEIPGDGSNIPGDDDEVPGDGSNIPGDDDEIPGDGSNIPGDDDEIPGDGSNIPGDVPGGDDDADAGDAGDGGDGNNDGILLDEAA